LYASIARVDSRLGPADENGRNRQCKIPHTYCNANAAVTTADEMLASEAAKRRLFTVNPRIEVL